MKNHSNVTANTYSGESITYAVTFGVVAVLGAIAIIVTSVLVLRHIYGKVKRSRADLLLIILSISDIGVGSLSQTSVAVVVMRKHIGFHMPQKLEYAAAFFFLFPYTFSYAVTAIVALDTLFVVTKQHSYTNFITKRRLMYIVVFYFAISVGLGHWLTYILYARARSTAFIIVYEAFSIALSVMIIGAYTFILCFVYTHSRTVSHCKNNGNRDFKKLTKTIMFIFASQVICSFPFQFSTLLSYIMTIPELLFLWMLVLRNTSSLFNGIILLLRERRKKKNKMRI